MQDLFFFSLVFRSPVSLEEWLNFVIWLAKRGSEHEENQNKWNSPAKHLDSGTAIFSAASFIASD